MDRIAGMDFPMHVLEAEVAQLKHLEPFEMIRKREGASGQRAQGMCYDRGQWVSKHDRTGSWSWKRGQRNKEDLYIFANKNYNVFRLREIIHISHLSQLYTHVLPILLSTANILSRWNAAQIGNSYHAYIVLLGINLHIFRTKFHDTLDSCAGSVYYVQIHCRLGRPACVNRLDGR